MSTTVNYMLNSYQQSLVLEVIGVNGDNKHISSWHHSIYLLVLHTNKNDYPNKDIIALEITHTALSFKSIFGFWVVLTGFFNII